MFLLYFIDHIINALRCILFLMINNALVLILCDESLLGLFTIMGGRFLVHHGLTLVNAKFRGLHFFARPLLLGQNSQMLLHFHGPN